MRHPKNGGANWCAVSDTIGILLIPNWSQHTLKVTLNLAKRVFYLQVSTSVLKLDSIAVCLCEGFERSFASDGSVFF